MERNDATICEMGGGGYLGGNGIEITPSRFSVPEDWFVATC